MAKEILENESRSLDIDIDDDPLCDEAETECPPDCDGKKCFKSYCNQCNGFDGCQCSCGKSDNEDSDGSDTDESKCDKAWLPDPKAWLPKPKMKYCDCKECDCFENKIPDEEDLGFLFERYQVWKSKTPGELVDELARKMVDIRYTRADGGY